jgi:ectoine hydroxylase-related dioxygenase (phytanoyl-CoA dioxygenase family)
MLSQPNALLRPRSAVRAPAVGYHVPDDDIADFRRDGVVCLRGVLNADQMRSLGDAIDALTGRIGDGPAGYDVTAIRRHLFAEDAADSSAEAQRQYDGDAIRQSLSASRALPLLDRRASGKGRFLIDTSTWRRDRRIRRLALDSALPEIAGQLLGASRVNFCDDQIFVKTGGAEDRTAFHQDYTYFRMKGWQGCAMWICADSADADTGVLRYVRGSHLWGREFMPNMFFAHIGVPGSTGESLEQVEADPQRYDLVQFAVEPGDVVVHHFRTVHGSGGNLSERPRRALSVRYAGDDMRYWRRPGTPDQPYHTHALRDGDRLDCEDFPVVWPRAFPGFSLADAYYDSVSNDE